MWVGVIGVEERWVMVGWSREGGARCKGYERQRREGKRYCQVVYSSSGFFGMSLQPAYH